MSAAQSLTIGATGAFVGLVGVLIRYFGYTNLIAGYDPDRVTDETGLAKFVGARVLAVAALTVAVGVAQYRWPDARWYWYAYGVLVAGLAAWLVVGSRRYEA